MLWIVALTFQRFEGNKFEVGIGIGKEPGVHDFEVIIDKDGNRLEQVWDYYVTGWKGSFILNTQL